MAKLILFFFLLYHAGMMQAQNAADTLKKGNTGSNADDPSQFLRG
jgi:hypothetical protein